MDSTAGAKHEAAHAFVAWARGGSLKLVTITGPLWRDGVAGHADTHQYVSVSMRGADRERLEAADLLAFVDVAVAPGVCDLERSGQLEIETALECSLMAKFLTNPDPTIQKLVGVAQRLFIEHPDDQVSIGRKFFLASSEGARELLSSPGARRVLDALTLALLKRGSLSGVEAVEIIERAWAPDERPTKALPIGDHGTGFSENNTPVDRLLAVSRLLKMAIAIADDSEEMSAMEEVAVKSARVALIRAKLDVADRLASLGQPHVF